MSDIKACKPILLKKRHLDRLFKITIENETIPFISNALNLDYQRVHGYIKKGAELFSMYEELLEEYGFLDIDIFDYEDEFKDILEDLKIEFCDIYKYEEINVKNLPIWEDYTKLHKAYFVEENRYRLEWDIIDKIRFVDNDILNQNIRLLVMLNRIYTRALATLGSCDYLSSIKKHSKTAKNVKLAENRLKKLYKEDFVEEIIDVKIKDVKVSLFDQLLEFERNKQKKLLSDDAIDVKFIEKKD